MRRLLTIGCGGLVVLIVLIVVLAAAFGGGEDTTGQAPGAANNPEPGEAEQAPKEPAQPPAAAIGETVTAGDVAWQVTNARQATQLTSEFQEPKQGNFVVVDFLFTNNGTEAVTLDSSSLALKDGEGRTFETDTDTFGYIDPSKDIFLNQVNPGVTQQGEVIFTVAPGASKFTLELGDAQMFSDKNAYVDLGF